MQPPLEHVSLQGAAILTGKDKSTIQKRLTHKDEKKRIIGEKDSEGEWKINFASLAQHYNIPTENIEKFEEYQNRNSTQPLNFNGENSTPRNSEFNTNSTHEFIELKAKVTVLEERIKDKDEAIQDLKKDKENLQNQVNDFSDTIRRQTLMLTDQREKTAPEPVATVTKKNPWSAIAAGLVLTIGATAAITYYFPEIRGTVQKIAQSGTERPLPQRNAAAIPDHALSNIEPAAGPTTPKETLAPFSPMYPQVNSTSREALGSPQVSEKATKGEFAEPTR
jgi:hypothetical protein